MIRKLLLTFFLFQLVILFVHAQSYEKVWMNTSDSVYGYYVVIPPASHRVQGALILLDGFGGNADGFFAETKIHNTAYANDILTICIPTGPRLYADSSMIGMINDIASRIAQRYSLRKEQFAIGGMSSGGTIALRYAELCRQDSSKYPVKPQAVFAIDAPVDLIGSYYSSENEIKRGRPEWWWLGEARMVMDKLKTELGDPNVTLEKFHQVSPFYEKASDPGNEQFLRNMAVRTYHDVDVSWHINNRHRGIGPTNMLPASEMINRLRLEGNDQAEFVSSRIQGYRANGQRHPHSWNIVDEVELIQWLKTKLHFYPDHLERPFTYEAPTGWSRETIVFPFDFAPALKYKGFEELRFAPGWGDKNSEEKWAYTLLWWLDGKYSFTEKTLASDLEHYFTGLTRRRAIADGLNIQNFKPAQVSVRKVATQTGDIITYVASMSIFDAQVTKKPAVLHVKIHVKDCANSILLFEVAGSPTDTEVWKTLDQINKDFRCEAAK